MKFFWVQKLEDASQKVGLLCPICDKPNDVRSVSRRQHPEQAKTNPNKDPLADNYRGQWQCRHCRAWNTREELTE